MATTLPQFESVFHQVISDLRQQCQENYKLPTQVWEWFEKSLLYNTVGGKCNRGLSVVDSARLLLDRDLTPDEYFHAALLGWMIELLQAMMLVLDDIMDASHTRRGKPCWYRVPKVGMTAVNDAAMLESAIYVLLKKYFKGRPAYMEITELFHEVALKIELGQSYDMLIGPTDHIDFTNFTMEKYTEIAVYKTAYYSFYLPVALALLDTGKATPWNLQQAEEILIPMGEYFQVQDDFLDAFADPKVLGKIGTDIRDNKCSWLVIQALGRCDAGQRRVLEENYGRGEDECERVVKGLYVELGLEGVYREFEEVRVAELRGMIERADESEGLKRSVFEELLRKIHKRKK
ncbi:FPP/GGPP synthase family protein [Aspergillus ibericus CBS 121593]|uniref:ERG20 farnesyl diphosphate synthase n=1 Tax=Aspergillus ibericus CBS 121593 TaxID=1448316 RepID=A0A395GT29_9EURO|nr:ERG20 farnesyl diphosphate synthase [Aspergillus ibericus CBS 121593]RAK98741.1 ERG20 farnesyl diphosphate synthase [Aspergillus ibericus CBS 121593]